MGKVTLENLQKRGLSKEELSILIQYKEILLNEYSHKIDSIILYGSKARGDFGEDSDIDLLISIKDYDWKMGDKIRRIGYSLDAGIDYKFSIIVVQNHILEKMKKEKYKFGINLVNDGIIV